MGCFSLGTQWPYAVLQGMSTPNYVLGKSIWLNSHPGYGCLPVYPRLPGCLLSSVNLDKWNLRQSWKMAWISYCIGKGFVPQCLANPRVWAIILATGGSMEIPYEEAGTLPIWVSWDMGRWPLSSALPQPTPKCPFFLSFSICPSPCSKSWFRDDPGFFLCFLGLFPVSTWTRK